MSVMDPVVFCPGCNLAMYETEGRQICINVKCDHYQTGSLYGLLDKCRKFPGKDAAYIDKMMHDVPMTDVVDRVEYILSKCGGKRVLHLGSASGTLHSQIAKVAESVVGVDRNRPADWVCDLDDQPNLVTIETFDLVLCGEILEHLSNPGNLLREIRKLNCAVLITVPNAFFDGTAYWMRRGTENVNPEHVAWYSYHTLKTLLERYGFGIDEFHYYNGRPYVAEGLVMMAT